MNEDGTPSPLELALHRLGVSALWEKLGWPGKPGKSCKVPYRPEDKRESGSVFIGSDGVERFKDFKSGETVDAPGLLALVAGIDNSAACRQFIELAGVTREDIGQRRAGRKAVARKPLVPARKLLPPVDLVLACKPELPTMREPSPGEIDAIAELRGLKPAGLELAAMAGLLRAVEWKGAACWAVRDRSGWNAQFRRLDGKPFDFQGRKVKTLGIPGGRAAWPIGIPEAANAERVLLVEGVPDLLAAFHFIFLEGSEDAAAAVTMAGASLWIPSDALLFFAGKSVRIFPHVGDTSGAGESAGLRWQTQLEAAGARARCFDLGGLVTAAGEPVGDLNDAARIAPADAAELDWVSNF